MKLALTMIHPLIYLSLNFKFAKIQLISYRSVFFDMAKGKRVKYFKLKWNFSSIKYVMEIYESGCRSLY